MPPEFEEWGLMKNDRIVCVECGREFSIEDSDYVSVSTSSVQCPECGRNNYCGAVECDGFEVEDFEEDPDICDDTDEIYIEGYLSSDLVLDSENKKTSSKYKKMGVAKRKRTVIRTPVFEYRKAIAKSLPLDVHKGYRTQTEEELLFDTNVDFEVEQ